MRKLAIRVRETKAATAAIHINAYDFNVRVCPVWGYGVRSLPFDKRHFLLERIALHIVFRTPFNIFRHSTLLPLCNYGGPKLRFFNIVSAVALSRIGAETAANWSD